MLETAAGRFGTALDARAIDRIERYLDVLSVWNHHTRLTGPKDRDAIIERHVVDSMAPARLLPAEGLVIDVGSGAGFPGIVLGILRPDLPLVMIEPRRRRVSFLREVVRHLALPEARVLEVRAEDAAAEPSLAGQAKAVIARAIRLDAFLALAAPLVAGDGIVIAMQTPPARPMAQTALVLRDHHPYQLSEGRPRALLVFVPRADSPTRVP